MPDDLRDPRVGVKSYFDPLILELSRQQVFAYGLIELVAVWMKEGPVWNDGRTFWDGTPTELTRELALVDGIQQSLKDWTTSRVHSALVTLSNLGSKGFSKVGTDQQRLFRLDKLIICRTQLQESIPT